MFYSDTRTCFLCGHRKDRWECEQNPILKATVCEECFEPREYGTKNTRRVGHLSKHFPPFSVEFNESETAAFWGRSLCKYANASSATRYGCFSLWSRHDTIEYCLPRFRSAEQYLTIVCFCLQTTAYLDACLDPGTALKHPVRADQMAHHLLTSYRQFLVPTLPLVTKGAFCHV